MDEVFIDITTILEPDGGVKQQTIVIPPAGKKKMRMQAPCTSSMLVLHLRKKRVLVCTRNLDSNAAPELQWAK